MKKPPALPGETDSSASRSPRRLRVETKSALKFAYHCRAGSGHLLAAVRPWSNRNRGGCCGNSNLLSQSRSTCDIQVNRPSRRIGNAGPPRKSLRSRAVSNARWIAVSRVLSIGVQFLSLAWLSRLLTPADYGLVAMAMVVTNLANLLRDMGTTQALIQREELNDETVLTSFWFTVGIGLCTGYRGGGTVTAGGACIRGAGSHGYSSDPRGHVSDPRGDDGAPGVAGT